MGGPGGVGGAWQLRLAEAGGLAGPDAFTPSVAEPLPSPAPPGPSPDATAAVGRAGCRAVHIGLYARPLRGTQQTGDLRPGEEVVYLQQNPIS